MIGKGAYGEVYPAGKDGEQQQLVAKRFKRIEVEGLDETDNLRAVGDLYDSGFDNYAENSRYWAIMPRKDGEILNKMDDFWEMIDQEGDCGAFMEKARDAVIEESRRLFKLPAAPMHEFVISSLPYSTHLNLRLSQRYSPRECAFLERSRR